MSSDAHLLLDFTLRDFLDRLASTEPTPGGGSCAALVGALAAALGEMAVGFTAGKPKYAAVEEKVRTIGRELAHAGQMLRSSIQEDSDAYAQLSAAFKLKPDDPQRRTLIEAAAAIAAGVPFQTVVLSKRVLAHLEALAPIGNPNLKSDVEAAIHMARAAIAAAAANTRINLPYMRKEDAARIEAELDRVADS